MLIDKGPSSISGFEALAADLNADRNFTLSLVLPKVLLEVRLIDGVNFLELHRLIVLILLAGVVWTNSSFIGSKLLLWALLFRILFIGGLGGFCYDIYLICSSFLE